MKKPLFYGVGTALVTPFTEQGALDISMLRKLLENQLQKGADAVVLCGTTGESAVLKEEERRRIFQTAADVCHGKIPVIAGIGCNDTQRTVERARMAQQCGADGLLAVTPYYNKTSQRGAVQHFTAVANATPLPLLLYNIPSRTGMDLTPETVCQLAKLPSVVGIKEASGSMEKIAQLCASCPEGFAVYAGNDVETLPVLSLGGAGVISVASNLLPDVVHYICSDFRAGKMERAQRQQRLLTPLCRLLFEEVNPVVVKALMEAVGLPCGPCRLPLEQLTQERRSALLRQGLPLLMQHFQKIDGSETSGK